MWVEGPLLSWTPGLKVVLIDRKSMHKTSCLRRNVGLRNMRVTKDMKDSKNTKNTKVPERIRVSARLAGDSDGRKYKIENKTETNDIKDKARKMKKLWQGRTTSLFLNLLEFTINFRLLLSFDWIININWEITHYKIMKRSLSQYQIHSIATSMASRI